MERKQAVNWQTHFRYGVLIAGIISGWGIREAHKITPNVLKTVTQVEDLNKLEKVDIQCRLQSCGSLKCGGQL